MTRKSKPLRLERIAVALSAPESKATILDTINILAADNDGEITYVFIEDPDLIRAAQLPFAVEVCRATNVTRRIDSSELERGLRERARELKQSVRQAAERTGTKWSFEVVRQRTASAVLELTKTTDITFLAASSIISHGQRSVPNRGVMMHADPSPGDTVVVVIDRSAAGTRAVAVARKLARARDLILSGVVVAASQAGIDRIQSQLRAPGAFDFDELVSLFQPQFSEITTAVARYGNPAAVVLPISQLDASSERIHQLELEIDSPLVIVK